MSEYYPHEHNFIERPTEQLQARLAELHINNTNVCYTGERLVQVQREIGHISFELSERFREQKAEDVEAAWAEHQ